MTWYNNSNRLPKDRIPQQLIMTQTILICQLSLTIQGSCVNLTPLETLYLKLVELTTSHQSIQLTHLWWTWAQSKWSSELEKLKSRSS